MTIEERYQLSCYEEVTRIQDGKEVYLVRHNETGEFFVKKYVSLHNEQVYKRLQQERVLQIPEIELLIADEDRLIVIEEYVHGSTLENICQTKGLYSDNQLLPLMVQLCAVLECLHSCKNPIIHRDIKPSNIMVSKDGVVKLIDFSIAKEYREGANEYTILMGTQGFAAPEQCGFGQSDERTDIYGVGITMNYLITGAFPKDCLTQGVLKDVIAKCVSMDVNSRYQTATELRQVLQKLDSQLNGTQRESQINLKDGRWKTFLPVGFRTGKLWKMLLAIVGYALVFWFSVSAEVTDGNGNSYTGYFLIANQVAIFIFFIGSIFFVGNYQNIRYQFPFMNKNKILHWLLVPLYVFLYLIFVAFILVLVAN